MKSRHTFRIRAPLADVTRFHASAARLRPITPPPIPIHLRHAPKQLGDGAEMCSMMWIGLPLSFGFRAWKTRRLLEGAAA